MAAEAQVEYNFLSGNCGVKVSNLCLGTMVFGNRSALLPPDQLVNYETTVKILDHFTELGGNFIDTANMYCDGSTEEFIGDWMAGKEREKIVLATKCRFSFSEVKGIMPGLSRKAIMFNVEESLKRLKTDYIDLYQIHCWDNAVPLEETLSTLNDLVRAGKVHYLGGSNLVGWQLQEIYDINEKRNYAQFVTLQQLYNILDRQSELEPFEVCRNKGLGILPYSPLKGGLLTGKHKRDTGAEPGSRIDLADKVNFGRISEVMPKFGRFKDDEGYWKLDELLHSLANKHGKTVAQVSLRWLLQKPNVNSVIIGGKTVKQIEDNMGAGKGWQLSSEDMKEIDDLSALKKEYPYREVDMFNGDRLRAGCSAGRQF